MARRYRAEIAAVKAGEAPTIPRAPPASMERFPWEEAKDEIPAQVLVTLVFLARFMVGAARDEIRRQGAGILGQFGNSRKGVVKDEMSRAPPAA